MSALLNSVEHALATAASDTVKVAKFVETSVLPVLKSAQANASTIEAVTSLVSPQVANIERAGFAVLGVVINAIDAAGAAAGAKRPQCDSGRAARRGREGDCAGGEVCATCCGRHRQASRVNGAELRTAR